MRIDEAIGRLAFIKYLYKIGLEQSKKAAPFCWASVLTFHDAVELFLELAAEYLGVQKRVKEMRFMGYWNVLNPILKKKGKGELTQRMLMDKLNQTRIAFKHHGTPPSKQAIQDSRTSSTDFFDENAPIVFDVEFSEISLIDLVQYENARKSLVEAQTLVENGEKEAALDKAALAFAQLIDEYENKKRDEWRRSPFYFISHSLSAPSLPDALSETESCLEEIINSVEELQDVVRLLSLGLDYRRCARFKLLTPLIVRIFPSSYKIQRIRSSGQEQISAEDVQFCIDFVIESAITLQEFDFEVKPRKIPSLKDLI